MQSFEESPLKM